jgi:hypothetical protein
LPPLFYQNYNLSRQKTDHPKMVSFYFLLYGKHPNSVPCFFSGTVQATARTTFHSAKCAVGPLNLGFGEFNLAKRFRACIFDDRKCFVCDPECVLGVVHFVSDSNFFHDKPPFVFMALLPFGYKIYLDDQVVKGKTKKDNKILNYGYY